MKPKSLILFANDFWIILFNFFNNLILLSNNRIILLKMQLWCCVRKCKITHLSPDLSYITFNYKSIYLLDFFSYKCHSLNMLYHYWIIFNKCSFELKTCCGILFHQQCICRCTISVVHLPQGNWGFCCL